MSEDRPVAAQYCATFLKPEMLHIYRQITGLQRYQPVVWTQKREHADDFPFERIRQVRRPWTRELRRFWMRKVLQKPVQIYQGEARRLAQEMIGDGARLAHIYFGHIAVQMMPLIELRALPVVVSFHGADVMVDLERTNYRKAAQRMLQQVDLVLVRSESLAERVAALGCGPEKIRLQRTGIPLGAFPFVMRSAPMDQAWHFVQACRLIAKKGLSVSLRAFAEFARSYPMARFTIAGEGSLREELEREALELGIAKQMKFVGFLRQPELRELYEKAHLFLHPSEIGSDGNQEGVPNAMLEAMASGMPVLATRHGGIPEAVDDGVSGFLVSEGDVEALTAAMQRVTADTELFQKMSMAAHRAVSERFEQQAQIAVLERCYDEVIRG